MLFVGVSVSVVLKFSVLKLNRIGFQLRNPVVYWKYWKLQGGKLRVAQGAGAWGLNRIAALAVLS